MRQDRLHDNANEQSSDLIARSAFVLVLIATLISGAIVPSLFSTPMRSESRSILLAIYSVYGILLLLLCVTLFRVQPKQLMPVSRSLVQFLSRRGIPSILSFFLIETCLLISLFIQGIAPNLSALIIIAGSWVLIGLIIILLANLNRLREWLVKTQPVWISTGITLTIVIGFASLYFVNTYLIGVTHVVDSARGIADYRLLEFIGEQPDPVTSREYWQELGTLNARWLPYTYARIEPYQGKYINVNSAGLRQTANFVNEGQTAPKIYFFGGSTVWGDGARDDYTIPSHIARLFNAQERPVKVTNFGQVAYVSTQDLILFETQLALGNVPDIAVFYGGFNDIASTYINKQAGLPHNEINRVEEFYVGRLLDSGNIILKRPRFSLSNFDFSLVAAEGTPKATVDRYLANIRIIEAIAAEYKVKVLFVWQPAILYKQVLTAHEQGFVEENRTNWPEFEKLYQDADNFLRQRMKDEQITNIVILSDLFRDEPEYRFIDRVHLTEKGNLVVAEALMPQITNMLINNE